MRSYFEIKRYKIRYACILKIGGRDLRGPPFSLKISPKRHPLKIKVLKINFIWDSVLDFLFLQLAMS
jgi:hypothetical protein